MDLTKSSSRSLEKKRDRAYDRLTFNRQYPGVVERMIDQKNDALIRGQELASKKRLFPLEIAALPESDRIEALVERERKVLAAKQELPRRAVQQNYLRMAEKSRADAQQVRSRKLAALDSELEAGLGALRRKLAAAPASDPAAAREAYDKAAKEEEDKLSALKAKLEAEKKHKMDELGSRLRIRNEKLQSEFESASELIRANSAIDEESFGPGNILSIRNLKMHFSGLKAVDDLSFSIKKGDIFGLIGPNGAGKTTVFNCVTQFYKPTGGSVYYRDRFGCLVDLTRYRTDEIIKTGISRTFQNLQLVYYLSVLDNLLLGAHCNYRATLADQFLHLGQLKREEEIFRSMAEGILERLGLSQYKDLPPGGLPYGILKKVELARTLMSNPRMIILDEPAAGLNDAETEELAEVIRTIRKDFDCTIFLVEHDMNLVMGICDTVCAISFGKMLKIGAPEEIQNSPEVQEAYLGTD